MLRGDDGAGGHPAAPTFPWIASTGVALCPMLRNNVRGRKQQFLKMARLQP